MREARQHFKYRSNEFKTSLDIAKHAFSDTLNAAQTQFIEQQSANINTAKPEKFWNNFEKTFTRAVKTRWETRRINPVMS